VFYGILPAGAGGKAVGHQISVAAPGPKNFANKDDWPPPLVMGFDKAIEGGRRQVAGAVPLYAEHAFVN